MDYFEWIGATMAQCHTFPHNSKRTTTATLHSALDCLAEYEAKLMRRLIEGLCQIPGIDIVGTTDEEHLARRVPTVSFTSDRHLPAYIAQRLARENIFVWSGDFYAVELMKRLQLSNGVVRVGIAHYNTLDEIDRTLNIIDTAQANGNHS